MLTALGDEEQLLAEAQIAVPRSKQDASMYGTDSPLAILTERNLSLARELVLGKGGSGRSAETIASELTASMDELNLRAHAIQVAPQKSMELGKRK